MVNSAKKKNSVLFILVILVVLLTDSVLFHFIIKDPADTEGGKVGEILTLIAIPLSSIILIKKETLDILKIAYIFTLAYFIYLIFESLYDYNSFAVYPHVLSKFTPAFLIFFSYLIFKKDGSFKLNILYNIIFFLVISHILILKNEYLNVSSFLAHDRPIVASSTYLLLLPFLYYLNKYLKEKKILYLFGLYFTFFLLIFLQHRTVWGCMLVGLVFNFLLIKKIPSVGINFHVVFYLFILPFFGGLLMYSIILTEKPDFYEKIVMNIEDILNFQEQGTGSWRLDQLASYRPFIEENFFFGMRYKGFELPIQFYNPENNSAVFEDQTGHHIHNFYVHTMFYHGLIGLLILIFPLLLYVYKIFKINELSIERYTLFIFLLSGIVYGLSYSLPLYFYFFIGFGLATLILNSSDSKISYKRESQELIFPEEKILLH